MSNGHDDSIKVHGVDLLDAIRYLSKKNNRFIAITLQEIEDVLGEGSEEMLLIRKFILDGFNNYTRAIVKILFKEIED